MVSNSPPRQQFGTDGTIYVGSSNDKLYAISHNGGQRWTFTTGGQVESSPAVGADGTIYVGSFDDKLYAINSNGSQKWTFTTGGQVESSPVIGADGTIYVGSDDDNLYAINPDGSQKWAFTTGSSVDSSPAIGADGTIYVGSDDNNLYAINPDGSQKWVFATGSSVDSSPAVGADGTIYVGSGDVNLYAVNPDGSQKWAVELYLGDSSPAIGADGTIYVGSEDYLLAINPDGSLKWGFPTGSNVESSPAVDADGTIYVGSFDDNLYAINPDGSQKWMYTTGNLVESSPAIGADGSVYFSSSDQHLYALGAPLTTISVPASLSLGNSPVGDTVTRNLTIKNTGSTNPLFISSVTSNNSTAFAETGTTCPSGGLAPHLTCTIAIRFTPGALGLRGAKLLVNDNTATSPQQVEVDGTGTVTMSVSTASYGFGSVKDGSKAVKEIVVYNHQTNAVSLSEGFSGPNAGDFKVTGGSCTSTLAKTSACSLIVTYSPTAVGTESAAMTVTDSPDPLGPYMVSFSAAETIPESWSATKLIYGNVYQTASKTLSVTLTNNASTGSITLTGVGIGGDNYTDFAITGGSCPQPSGSLAASSSCTYLVTFTPSSETAESGAYIYIGVGEDPNGGPPYVALSGTGLVPLRVVPASIAFGTVAGGHSSLNKTVTVYNYGGATVSPSESITGSNMGDFTVTGGTCTTLPGGSLAGGGASCTYLLKFTPSIVGAESATLGVSASGDAASPHNVSLGGTGS